MKKLICMMAFALALPSTYVFAQESHPQGGDHDQYNQQDQNRTQTGDRDDQNRAQTGDRDDDKDRDKDRDRDKDKDNKKHHDRDRDRDKDRDKDNDRDRDRTNTQYNDHDRDRVNGQYNNQDRDRDRDQDRDRDNDRTYNRQQGDRDNDRDRNMTPQSTYGQPDRDRDRDNNRGYNQPGYNQQRVYNGQQNADVRSRIQTMLQREPSLANSAISVNVNNSNQLVLTGSVPNNDAKVKAEQLARSAAGNQSIINQITVSNDRRY